MQHIYIEQELINHIFARLGARVYFKEAVIELCYGKVEMCTLYPIILDNP